MEIMTHAERDVVEAYSVIINNMSAVCKKALMEQLSKSLKDESGQDDDFYQLYGAWKSDQSAEEMIADLRAARKYREKDIRF
jgi:HPt (histidine-containing phosphotransfer) domain-containing protein